MFVIGTVHQTKRCIANLEFDELCLFNAWWVTLILCDRQPTAATVHSPAPVSIYKSPGRKKKALKSTCSVISRKWTSHSSKKKKKWKTAFLQRTQSSNLFPVHRCVFVPRSLELRSKPHLQDETVFVRQQGVLVCFASPLSFSGQESFPSSLHLSTLLMGGPSAILNSHIFPVSVARSKYTCRLFPLFRTRSAELNRCLFRMGYVIQVKEQIIQKMYCT